MIFILLRKWNVGLKVYGRIECKLGPVSSFMAISQSEYFRQVRHLVNFVDELTKIDDNVSGCKLGPISNFMATSHSEELRQVRQFVNSSILLTN